MRLRDSLHPYLGIYSDNTVSSYSAEINNGKHVYNDTEGVDNMIQKHTMHVTDLTTDDVVDIDVQ